MLFIAGPHGLAFCVSARKGTHAMKEIWFESQGCRLFAVESGAGEPIILVHGGLAMHLACRVLAGSLDEQFRLITPDLRACGRSHFAGELSWELYADDVAALAKQLGIERAVVGGVSFGCGVAVKVALRHPQLVSGLVLLHPAYGGADVGLAPAQRAAMDAMDAFGQRTLREGIEALLPLFDQLPEPARTRVRTVAVTYDPASVAASTAFMASGAQPFAHGRDLAEITAPALVVPGIDPQHPREVADVFARNLSNVVVRDVAAGDFAAAIAAFVRGQLQPTQK